MAKQFSDVKSGKRGGDDHDFLPHSLSIGKETFPEGNLGRFWHNCPETHPGVSAERQTFNLNLG